jgi:gamma-glutamylputrescine oxidase
LEIKKKNPTSKVLLLERGFLPTGASSKNAGFACFGSATELIDDLSHIPEKEVWETVEMRWKGIAKFKENNWNRPLGFTNQWIMGFNHRQRRK